MCSSDLRIANEKTTFTEAFSMADDVLYQGVKGVTDLMVRPGLINLGFAICGASAGILCVPALLGGVYGGGRLGSQVGKGKNFLFSVVGQNSNGRTVAQSFRLMSRKTSKKLKKELSQISGLKKWVNSK